MNNKLYDCPADATCYGIHRYEEIYMSHTIDRAEILDCVHGRRLKARGIAVDDHGKVRMPGGSLAQVGRLKLIAGGVPKEPEAPGGRGRVLSCIIQLVKSCKMCYISYVSFGYWTHKKINTICGVLCQSG